MTNYEKIMSEMTAEKLAAQPLDGPLMLSVQWMFRATDKHHTGEWRTEKPDLDNANKMLQDQMQKLGFFHDDKDISLLQAGKIYSAVPGIHIKLVELDE